MSDSLNWAVVIATFVGPIVAVIITLWHQDRSALRERRSNLLRQLAFGRHVPGDPSYSLALTLIPLEWAHDRAVIEKYKSLREHLNNPPNGEVTAEGNSRIVDLIVAMASSLGYKYDHAALRELGFVSNGMLERDNLYLNSLRAQVEIARHTKRNADVGETVAARMPAPPAIGGPDDAA